MQSGDFLTHRVDADFELDDRKALRHRPRKQGRRAVRQDAQIAIDRQIGDRRAGKPSEQFDDDAPVEIRNRAYPWVSRGGVKLAHALDGFNVSVEGKTVLDIGASTGGFTHVCLTRGASRIYAVDVGTDQLAPPLRQERRVVSLEGTDCRALSRTLIKDPIELIVCDVSFIGLETALPVPLSLAEPGCELVALVKPQFEVGRAHLPRTGVVVDLGDQDAAAKRIERWIEGQIGWRVLGLEESPIRGKSGNRELFVHAQLKRDSG